MFFLFLFFLNKKLDSNWVHSFGEGKYGERRKLYETDTTILIYWVILNMRELRVEVNSLCIIITIRHVTVFLPF